jgi:hypothetical protein
MRRTLLPALIVILSGVISCSDMPTAPRGNVAVEGLLTDRDGAAMRGATVVFLLLPTSQQLPTQISNYVYTDAGGAFNIALPPGIYEVQILPGYQSGTPRVKIPKFEAKGSHVRLDYHFTGARITGKITGPAGTPLSAASVDAYSVPPSISASSQLVNGRYSLLLGPGDYDFYIHSAGYNDGLPVLEYEVAVSAADSALDFVLTGNRVTTMVTLRGAAPLAGAQVTALSGATGVYANARTGLDGIVVLYLPSGGYSYTVYPPFDYIAGPETGYWPISGDGPFTIDFDRVQWDVTLRSATDSSVIASAYVSASELGSNRYANAFTDPVGKFQILARPGQGYDLRVGSPFSNGSGISTIPNVSSAADSTFDLFVNLLVP